MIVWIASYPRSGNNLFIQTLEHVFGFDLRVCLASVMAEPGLTPLLEALRIPSEIDALRALEDLDQPIFLKTHRVSDAADPSRAVYIVRDGRDSLVSYAHFLRSNPAPATEGRSFDESVAVLMRQRGAFGGWSANVRAWTQREAPTAVARYEELVGDTAGVVGGAIESLGVPMPDPTGELPSFEELRNSDPRVYRRGRVGSWKDEMPAALEELFWNTHGEQMHALGYPR